MLDENAQYHLRGVRQMRKFRAEQDWGALPVSVLGTYNRGIIEARGMRAADGN
jgi:hypothetical protein